MIDPLFNEDREVLIRDATHKILTRLVPVKLLIWIIGGARPNLKKVAIGRVPIRDIQTLVAEDPDVATGECPFLRHVSSANLDSYNGAVAVGSRRQAFICDQFSYGFLPKNKNVLVAKDG